MSARGVRRPAAQRAGARGRGHHVLRRDRGDPGRRGRQADRPGGRHAAGVGQPRAAARRGGGVRGRATGRHGPPGAQPARRRTAHDRSGAHRAVAARDRAPRAPGPARAAGLAAAPVRRPRGCRRTQPPPGQRRRGRADHDGVRGQGPAVPDRVFALHVQPLRRRRRHPALSRRHRHPLPVHRRQGPQPPAPGGRGVAPPGGGAGQHPPHLRRADPGVLAGGGVVGADPRRGQRRALAAAARPRAG